MKRVSLSATSTFPAPTILNKALKTTLKAEINEDARSTLHSDIARPFPKPRSGRIAVKVQGYQSSGG
jgi:hypothetical protein